MRVDGGKALSSRGQQDWYGMQYMNRKFEHDPKSYYKYMLLKKKVGDPPQGRAALEDWIENVQTSQWSTRTDDAHAKYMSMYNNVVEDQNQIKNAAQMHKAGAMNNPAVARPIQDEH